jgi:hypothetical protein
MAKMRPSVHELEFLNPTHRSRRRMNRLFYVLLATLTATSNAHAAESAPEALLKKIGSLAGSNSQDCGSVAQPGDRGAAFGCAARVAESGRAYRFAVQLQSSESLIWQGAARDESGRLWVVFYDSNRSDGPAAGPTLSVLRCREIVLALRSNDDLECKPFTGDP